MAVVYAFRGQIYVKKSIIGVVWQPSYGTIYIHESGKWQENTIPLGLKETAFPDSHLTSFGEYT